MNIAVVDAGANLVAFERMDGAWLGSIDITIDELLPPGRSTLRRKCWPKTRRAESSFSVSTSRITAG